MKTLELPDIAKSEIKKYLELNLGKKGVRCPYYMNIKKSKDLRAMVGKGTPEEIEMEAKIWEKLKGVHFREMKAEDIRDFLISKGIGIDCSGFVIHVLNSWFKEQNNENIWKKLTIPNKTFLGKISYKLKPVEKLGAEIITNSENSKVIDLKDVLPGDVIRSKFRKQNSHHILIISKVKLNKDNTPELIEYTHSSQSYTKQNGVKTGEIKIIDINKPLEEQEWLELDEDGINHTLEGFMIQLDDNGLRRLKLMEVIQSSKFK